MLYLDNTTTAQVAFIPKNVTGSGGTLVLTCRSTIDLDTPITPEVDDLGTSELYYNLALSLPDGTPSGEYEYTLTDDGVTVATGLLIITESTTPTQYDKTIIYEQYNATE